MSKVSDAEPTDPTPIDPETIDPALSEPAPNDFDFNLPQSTLPDGYYDERGVPGFDAVRERIEQISAQADGREILDGEPEVGVDYAQEREKLDKAGKDRLAQIRKSMGL